MACIRGCSRVEPRVSKGKDQTRDVIHSKLAMALQRRRPEGDVMKLSLIAAGLIAIGPSLVSAQSAQPATGEHVTVAGCVQRAQRNGSLGGTVLGTSAAPNTADDEANSGSMVNGFLLTEATPVVAGSPDSNTSARAETTPAATGTSGRVEPTTFGLRGREAELERHQGARLQVTGTIIPPASSGRGTGGAATETGIKRIEVESFKILADHCTAQ
jgi:hypothetical protein